MERVEREGLCDEMSLEIFTDWYAFGGVNRGLSLSEILQMPSWLRKDFKFILSTLSRRRREQKNRETVFSEGKKGKKSARPNGRKSRR